MNFLEKLDTLMAQKGLNRKTLSEVSGVPYTTIIGFYAKGYEGTRMSTVKSLAHFFNVSTDYLIRDEITDPNYGLSAPADPVLAPDERRLVTDYRAFNEEGKEKIRDYVADLADNPKYKKCVNPPLDQEA